MQLNMVECFDSLEINMNTKYFSYSKKYFHEKVKVVHSNI